MKHLFLLSISSLLFIFFIGCSEEEAQSCWLNKSILVDGNGKDWKDIPLTFNEDLNLIYGMANNDTSVNLMIRFSDQDLANKLSRRGMTLWLNETNEEEKLLGIHYVDESARELKPGKEGGFDRNQTPDLRAGSQQPFVPGGTFTLALKDSKTGTNIKNVRGLEAAAGYWDGLYCFEFKASLNEPEKTIHSLSVPGDGKINACLEIGPMTAEEQERMKKKMAQRDESVGRGGGTKGGGRGGGRKGGGMKGSSSQMQTIDTDGQEMWITIMLASKNK
jgi:hypothetical protein